MNESQFSPEYIEMVERLDGGDPPESPAKEPDSSGSERQLVQPWWVKREWDTETCDCVRCGRTMGLNEDAEWSDDPAYNFCNVCAHDLVVECMDRLNSPIKES